MLAAMRKAVESAAPREAVYLAEGVAQLITARRTYVAARSVYRGLRAHVADRAGVAPAAEGAPASDASPPAMPVEPAPGALDWTDPAAVKAWLGHLREAWDDAALVASDMLRRKRKRALGHAEAARLHGEASASMEQLLAHAGAP